MKGEPNGAAGAGARTREQQPVPRGLARAEAPTAIAAEARARIAAGPSLFDLLTPEDIERMRESDLPEILGYGPTRKKNSSE